MKKYLLKFRWLKIYILVAYYAFINGLKFIFRAIKNKINKYKHKKQLKKIDKKAQKLANKLYFTFKETTKTIEYYNEKVDKDEDSKSNLNNINESKEYIEKFIVLLFVAEILKHLTNKIKNKDAKMQLFLNYEKLFEKKINF